MAISLKAARVNAGMTQSDVAKSMKVSLTTISNWEAGKVDPSWADYVFLCNLYKLSTSDIFLPSQQQ